MEKTSRHFKFLQIFTGRKQTDDSPQTQEATDKHFTPFKSKHAPKWLSSRLRRETEETLEMSAVRESKEGKSDTINKSGTGGHVNLKIANDVNEKHYGAIQE